MNHSAIRNVLIVGVGGQGVLLASDVLATVCLANGHEVKKSEVHGMAKRGGVVYSHLRYGARVLSPLIEPGTSDVLLAFEPAEALRWSQYVKPGGTAIVNSRKHIPPAACRDRRFEAATRYPGDIEQSLKTYVSDLRAFDAESVAIAAGDHRTCNSVLLGALSNVCEFSAEQWLSALEKHVKPKTIKVNQQAFMAGRDFAFPAAKGPQPPAVVAKSQSLALDTPRIVIRQNWCKGCEICVVVCPQNCLRMNDRNVAELVTAETCIRCMLCELLCPDLAVSVH